MIISGVVLGLGLSLSASPADALTTRFSGVCSELERQTLTNSSSRDWRMAQPGDPVATLQGSSVRVPNPATQDWRVTTPSVILPLSGDQMGVFWETYEGNAREITSITYHVNSCDLIITE